MNKDDLKELIRRLDGEGLIFRPALDGIGTVSGENDMDVSIEEDGAILYKHENKPLAMKVMDLYNQVQEYMPAFRKAPQGITAYTNWLNDTRTLLLFSNCELAANRFSDGNMEFITWKLDRNGAREAGHYYSNFTNAKQDFAIRAELIGRDVLFSEKELTVIRSHLSDYLALEDALISGRQEDAIKEVISKIDNIIAPEIQENAEKADELGYEPEFEL